MMTFIINDITTCFYCFLSGTIVTVANVGDSRVILGYQKDISPPGSSPRPKNRVTAPDSPGTSHEEISVHLKPKNGEDASTPADRFSLGVEDVEVDTRQWGIITTMPLSTDHKPDDPREAAVIIAAGKSPCLVLSCLDLSCLVLSHLISSHLSPLLASWTHYVHAQPFNHASFFCGLTYITLHCSCFYQLSYWTVELLLARAHHRLACRAILFKISYSICMCMYILQADE